MRARRCQRDHVPRSSNVTGARSDVAPEAFLSSSDDFPITTSRSRGLPLTKISNLSDVQGRKDSGCSAYPQIDDSTTANRVSVSPGVVGPSVYSAGRSVSRRRLSSVRPWKSTERPPSQRLSRPGDTSSPD
jgi:hypothetical protein